MNSKALFSLFSHSLTLTIHYYFFPFTVFCWYCCCCWYCYCCLSRCAEDPLISGQTNKQTRGKLNSRSNSSTTTTTRAARLTSSHTFPPALSLSLICFLHFTSLQLLSVMLLLLLSSSTTTTAAAAAVQSIAPATTTTTQLSVCLSVCLPHSSTPSLSHTAAILHSTLLFLIAIIIC